MKFSSPALFSYGFRPFFLFGAVFATLSLGLWMLDFTGLATLAPAFQAQEWHIHEMLFGYLAAVIAGFLFTAIPNWTGRLPLKGLPLIALTGLWLAGRAVMLWPGGLGWSVVMIIDVAFLAAIVAVVTREIIAGQNYRNLRVLVPVGILLLANVTFHLEVHLQSYSAFGRRMAFAAILTLIMLVGGRIIPSFTRNWLVRKDATGLPQPFGRFDGICIVIAAISLLCWIVTPLADISGALLILAGFLHMIRLSRWAGLQTWPEPLLLILHIAYGFLAIGLMALGAGILWPEIVAPATSLHLLGIGAMGGMTLSVMMRASAGHTGRELTAGRGLQLVFMALVASALLRVWASETSTATMLALILAAMAWMLAFGGFVAIVGSWLVLPKTGARKPAQRPKS